MRALYAPQPKVAEGRGVAAFSIGEAVKSGFQIIRDHPAAILMWSLAYFVIVLLPQGAMIAAIWPDIVRAGEEAARSAGPDGPTSEEIEAALGMQGEMMLMQLVQIVTGILWMVLFYGAVYRVVLEPQNRAHWYMRLGDQELWLGVVSIVAFVIFFMVIMAAMIPAVIFGVAFTTMGGRMTASGWIVGGLLVAACFVAFFWAAIRLSLAYPMSFAERKFRLFESWALTRGHAWRMFLTVLAVIGLVLLLELLLFVLLIAAILVIAGILAVDPQGALARFIEDPLAAPPALLVGIVLAISVIASILMTALYTIIVAPAAVIYQRLSASPGPALAA